MRAAVDCRGPRPAGAQQQRHRMDRGSFRTTGDELDPWTCKLMGSQYNRDHLVCGCNSVVEYHVANVVVVGSIPITRSRGKSAHGRFAGMVQSGPWETVSLGPLALFGQWRFRLGGISVGVQRLAALVPGWNPDCWSVVNLAFFGQSSTDFRSGFVHSASGQDGAVCD